MHVDQVVTDVALVQQLLMSEFPKWADLPIEPVSSFGTDHDIYRLGRELAVRLPIIGWAEYQAAKEGEWLPRLAPHLPVAVPVPVATGRPAFGYPFSWSVYEWLPGVDASSGIQDLETAAVDLARFIKALRVVESADAPKRQPGSRGGNLGEFDEGVRLRVGQLGDRVDGKSVLRCWDESLEAGPWVGPEVWVHGDLLPGNLLIVDGRLSAVIDFGGLNVGDPACDLQPAWNLFVGASRARFRAELDVDDESWLRGRGWVVFQTVSALAYYWDTNPEMVRHASFALSEALSDPSSAR